MQMYDAGKIYDLPDGSGHFGPYGGVFVAETLMHALDEFKRAVSRQCATMRSSRPSLPSELKHYVGRPSPVYHASRLSEQLGGAQIWLKREDLNHTGAHKINNTIGQALLARAHGQEARHRRDRRRSARRRHRHRRGALRHGMRGVHGLGGHQAPGDERLSHEAAGRHRGAGGKRFEDAEGRAQRSDARLGDQRREHVLHHRHGRRPASLSDDGARFQCDRRHGAAHADAGSDRPPARRDSRVRGRRFQRDGRVLRRTSRTVRCA